MTYFLGKILSSILRLWKQEYLSSSSYLVLVALSWCHSKLEVAILRGYEITVDLFFLVNIFSCYFATPANL